MTRGEIWWADFGIPFASEPGFRRPVLIVQDDGFNKSNLRTIVIVPLSTNLHLADAPGNVFFEKSATGLAKDSVVVTSQMVSVDRERLIEQVSKIDSRLFAAVEEGMMVVLAIRRYGL